VAIAGLHFVANRRPGKPVRWFVYAWRGGPCIMKVTGARKPALTPAAVAAFHDAIEDSHKVKRGTLGGSIRAYRKSASGWLALEPSTRRTWERHLTLIEDRWCDTPMAFWSDARMRGKIISWRDERAATPRTADIGVDVLQHLLQWALLQGEVTINLAAAIPKIDRPESRAAIIWTAADMAAFAAVASRQCSDAVRLAALTGLRRADLCRVSWAHVGDFAITMTAEKKSRGKRQRVTIPIIPKLHDLLAELRSRAPRKPGVETLLINGKGEAWTPGGLTQRINGWRDKANIVHQPDEPDAKPVKKHLHDIRGTFATELMMIVPRLTDQEIADLMGWSVANVANIRRCYVDDETIIVSLAKRIANSKL
jgi:integrase